MRGADGEKVVGRTSLQLLNPAFEHLALKRMMLLIAQLTPRFPELGADGMVRQTARVYHHHKQPVTLTRVLRYTHTTDGASSEQPVAIDPALLFGSGTLPPEGATARLELDGRAGIFSHEYTLEGQTPDGLPAQGAFSVMRPPDRPTRDNHTPVVDALLKAKILHARELLEQPYVTDEDLIRRGAQGAFDDLVEQAAKGPAPAGEAPLPPSPAK